MYKIIYLGLNLSPIFLSKHIDDTYKVEIIKLIKEKFGGSFKTMGKDENSRYIASKVDTTGYIVSFFLIVIIAFWKRYHGIPYGDLFAIILIQRGISNTIKYKNKIEEKAYLIFGVIDIIVSIIFLADFFLNG